MIKSYVSLFFLLCALSASHSMYASEPAATPDVLDDTIELPQFPAPAEAQDTLSEPDKNLILSAYKGDLATVEILVAKGADVNVQDKKKRTPLIFAASNGHTPVIGFLISKGADVNMRDSGGRTALLYASKRSFNETAALLLEKGADVNVQSKKKKVTALMLAAVWDNTVLVRMLLDHGADPHLVDIFGRSAKVLAEKKGNSAVVELLTDPSVQ